MRSHVHDDQRRVVDGGGTHPVWYAVVAPSLRDAAVDSRDRYGIIARRSLRHAVNRGVIPCGRSDASA